jgi:ABC-type multidrug transport system fused ATPase/permease subunit
VLQGALGDRTRIMATNQLQYLPRCDMVVVLRNGRVQECGKYADLVKSGLDFATLMKEFGFDASDAADATTAAAASPAVAAKKKASTSGKVGSSAAAAQPGAVGAVKGALMTKETREEGLVSLALYWRMGRLAGTGWFLGLLLFGTAAAAAKIIGDWWLSQWTTAETLRGAAAAGADISSSSNNTSLLVPLLAKEEFLWAYVGIGVGEIVLSTLVGFVMVFFSLNVSRRLHDGMLRSLMRAPMSFFDQTPIGRISNRFSFDLDLVDFRLPFLLQQYIVLGLRTIGVLVVVAFTSYYTVIGCVAIAVIYYMATNYYRHTAIELQRLESNSRSPIFAHFIETLQGLSSVRAYGQEQNFLDKNNLLLNKNVQALYTRFYAASWLQLRLGLLGSFCTLIVMLIAILADIAPGLVALTLTYAVAMTQLLSQLSRQATDTETHMNGVERTLEYSELAEEAPAVVPDVDDKLPAGWPRSGKVSFKNVSMRYRPELDPVLRGVSFDIGDREKIGIVGRTGSGKSSILNTLLRIVEADDGGVIEIDGVDVRTIGLKRLRRAMAIIPQDPMLFTNTVRYNVDPFDEHTDDELWDALRLASLADYVRSLEGGLSHEVLEGGENFSVGQRQLLCVARALVRKPKILLLDEASAGIDMKTDELLQTMIRDVFHDSTIITIAHRLNTIIDYDRVIVLDHGRLTEYAEPGKLLESSATGLFASLVDATGAKSSRRLREIASERLASKRGDGAGRKPALAKVSRPMTAAAVLFDEESAESDE